MDKKKSFIIFFGLLLASFVFFSFGTISSAATQEDINNGYYEVTNKYLTDGASSTILSYWAEHSDKKCYAYNTALPSYMEAGFFIGDVEVREDNGTNYFYADGYVYRYDMDSWNASPNSIYTQSSKENQNILRVYEGYQLYEIPWESINFDNLIYATNIPVPELEVTYIPAISMLGGLPETNNVFTSINVQDNEAFKVQLAVKITVADMVQIGLNDGTITYKYLDWTEGNLSDIYSLQDQQEALDVYVSNDDLKPIWSDLYNSLYDDSDFPIFSSSVPFWNSNPNASKYLNAQSYYRNNMARQMPMYGTRLEVFARYFAIVDENVFVGAWRHWNSAEPLNTEKVTDKYQDQQPFPGTENTNTNVDYDNEDDTYTNIGTQTGVYTDPYTQVIINQNVPNYPDYPTAVSYNHDNILLQFIQTANQLPNFFGQFGQFLTATFSFIDSSVWAIIGFGFMCSIVVMIIKIL